MPAHLTILASGSSGNAAFLHDGTSGILIDCGIGPRLIAYRLAAVGFQWANVSAVVLTHTHGDHWTGLPALSPARPRTPLSAPARHHEPRAPAPLKPPPLQKYDLVRTYEPGVPFEPVAGVTANP